MKKCTGYLLVYLLLVTSLPLLVLAQEPEFPPPATRTIVADVLDREGEFIIVRGELGEIRIEVKNDTKISEKFKFGDRVKAVLRPNNDAISVERAGADEPTGLQVDTPASAPAPQKSAAQPITPVPPEKTPSSQAEPSYQPSNSGPATRIIVADLLMVDGDFYVVRSEYGEIRIEATPDTKMAEAFGFGDRIKAKVLPNDKAIFIERAKPEDPIGIQTLEPAIQPTSPPTFPIQKSNVAAADPKPKTTSPRAPENSRTIVAEVLMVDGDFIIVRGERGEIQIEVTAKTKQSEKFDYGDKIKAIILPNDRAVSVQRATPDEPIGITEN